MKKGFRIIVGEEELQYIRKVGELLCWSRWLERFVSPKSFEVSWDNSVRGTEQTARGVL